MKTIIFDLGGVLIYLDQETAVNNFLTSYPWIDPVLFRKTLFESELKKQYEKGALTTRQYFNVFLTEINAEIEFRVFKEYYLSIFTLNNELVNFISTIRHDYQLYVLSNTNELHMEHISREYPFFSMFHKVYLSYQLGLLKPDKNIYKTVIRDSCINPGETLFIDDSMANIKAAEKCGMNVIHFQCNSQFFLDFKKIIKF